MKLYAYSAPDIPKHAGYLKIGETHGDIDKRIKQQGHELNVNLERVWDDFLYAERRGIDKELHRFLKQKGFHVQQFDETGRDAEWVRCTVSELKKAFIDFREQFHEDEKKRQALGEKFYLEIRNWYYWASSNFPDPDTALRIVVRLLFCYFLREKELVPKELFEEHFIKEHLKENKEYRYHNAILRNLFFHCLNTPIAERKENIEHKELIKNTARLKEQFNRIPFLNGGLFDEHEGDEIPLGNRYFFSEPETYDIPELGGKYKVAGIIWILSQYQYKLSLDDLLDREEYVETVDPEFIGKVFESLLSCIDAGSKESRRKVTGSYYTPREIVDYMVNEALDAYLEREPATASPHGDTVPGSLLQCKILDPACGSGAFPCGIMNEIMRRIDPPKEERYRTKLKIVRDVVYGVDIQPMAVQITLLRFFLSLIQDIVPDKRKTNYGIEPLPNLETKFVCADSLIPLVTDRKDTEGRYQKMLEDPIIRNTTKLLQENRNQYFMANMVDRKREIQQTDKTLRETLAIALESNGMMTHDTTKKVATWNPYNQSHSTSFFDSIWMFGVEKFDIVIGNPPYVEAKKLKKIAVNLKHYDVYSGTADLSVYFLEKGLNLLKRNGLLMLITTNKFFNTEYGKLVRKKIIKHQIRSIIDFEQVKVFESALISSVIIGIENCTPYKNEFVYRKFYKLKNKDFTAQFVGKTSGFGTYRQSLLDTNEWSFADNAKLELKNKIEKAGKKLSKVLGVAVYRGVTTGYNPAFIIDENKKNELIAADPNCEKIIKPLLQGRNVRKWVHNGTKCFLLQTGYDTDIKNKYPAVFKHLRQFQKELKIRDDQGKNWFNLRACRYYSEFEKSEKIIWGLTADKWAYAYDDGQHYLPSNGYILTSKKIPIKYLLGLLNSNLLKLFFGFIGIMTAGGAFTLKYTTIQQLPIVIANDLQPIITFVDKILSAKKANPSADTTDLERKIDLLVYKLYGLTKAEIAIIEG